jgi:hypothetical protein
VQPPPPSLHAPAHVCPAEHVAGPHGGHALGPGEDGTVGGRGAAGPGEDGGAPQNVAVEGVDPDSALELMVVSVEGTAMGPVRPAQFLNALLLMLVTAVPMTKEVSPEFSKAVTPMLPAQLIATVVRLAVSLNASTPMPVTAVPMTNEVSPEFAKASKPMLPVQLMDALMTPW